MRYFKQPIWALSFFIIAIVVTMLTGFLSPEISQTYAQKGVLDLSGRDLKTGGTVKLDGQWEFYWDKLLTYHEIQDHKPDLYTRVPETWNKYNVNGENLPGQGYATYRLHVKTGIPVGTAVGLRAYTFSSAYRLYVNDMLLASNGRVGTNEEEETGQYKPQTIIFDTPAKDFDIIIQVSNFHYARGGFWYSMYFGNADGIMAYHTAIRGKEIFLLGVLAIISLFYLTMFIFQKELKYSLYFACLCIMLAITLDMVGQFVILGLLPSIGLKLVIFIWYSAAIWMMFFLILYVHGLFKSGFSTNAIRVYFGIYSVFQILFIFTPPTFYARLGNLIDFVNASGAVCTIIIVSIGIKSGHKDGWLNIASAAVALATYIHDDLYWMNIIDGSNGEMIYAGIFIVMFLQIILQARRFKQYHDSKIAAEVSFLQAQIKPHFLYNTLNTIISISRYDSEKARELLYDFSVYLRKSFDFEDLSQFVFLKNEIDLARAYGEIEKARFEERLEMNFEVCDDPDLRVPILILQPVIENAVNHGVLPKPEGGKVDISVKRNGKLLIFSVKDNGVGMEEKKKNSIMERKHGSGVGLANINRRLRMLYGKGLHIESSPGLGTTITWSIPADQQG